MKTTLREITCDYCGHKETEKSVVDCRAWLTVFVKAQACESQERDYCSWCIQMFNKLGRRHGVGFQAIQGAGDEV